MFSVAAAIIALGLGVALVPVAQKRPAWMAMLDGFMLVAIGGVLAMDLLPYSFQTAGWWAALALVIGAGLPALLERGHHHDDHAHDSAGFLIVAAIGLAVHAFLDGGALATRQVSDGDHSRALELSVLLHRLPMGVMLGMLAGANKQRLAWIAAGIIALGTVGGFFMGLETLPSIGLKGLALFQALVAGTLVHVLYTHSPIRIPSGQRRSNTIGMLVGILCLAAMHSLHH
jgi:zinc transporter ZupT